ncbi:MAG: PEP-CTERM system TPR-repeat protein PrsT, partial [Acetobacteraceae bacterium]|nr:PEP-CTERM system TPR-repeat protein PrsT [Acetobacteraceae bacterium]
ANAEAHALLSQVQILQGDPIAAEKEVKRAGELNWDKNGVQTVLAQAYLAQGKWNEIRTEIPRAGTTPGQTAYFLMVHAVAERAQNEKQAAQKTIVEAERADPTNAEVEVTAARFAIADGNRDLANQKLDHALELSPKRLDALTLKAQVLTAAGDRKSATAMMDRAIEISPAPNLRLDRASLYLAQGLDAKAKEDVDAVLAKDGKNSGALYVNAVLLIRQGKFQDADLVMQRLDPVLNQFQRGLYFKAIVKASVGQVAQAEDAAIAYVSRYPNDPDGVRLLARVELNARRPARAIPALVNMVNAGQTDAETLDLLGRAYAMDGKRSEAEATFKRASSVATGNASSLTRLASSRLQTGDLAGATTDLEHSLDIAPEQPGALQALFFTSLAMGDLDRAQQTLDRLRQQAGDTDNVGLLTGLLKMALLDPQGALDQFLATAQKYPDSAPAKINAAKLLIQMNRRPEAEKLLTEMLDKNPAMPEPLSLLAGLYLEESNRGPDAVKLAERARAAAPTNLGIVAGEAELLARLGDLQRAQDVLDSAKVNGVTPVALLPTLGRIQLALGQNDAAKASFAALVAAEPNNLLAVRAQVELLARLKEFDAARDAAQQAVQRQPGNLAALELRLAVELQDQGLDPALAVADRLRAEPANMPAAAVLKGDLLMGARRFKDAAAAFSDEFKREPSSALVVRLAAAEQAGGDPQAANAELTRWLASHPNDADAAQLLASNEIVAHQLTEAERNLQIVLSQRPNDVAALNNMAWIYQERGDKRARQFAQRAYLQAPNPEVGDTFAWILVAQGEPAKALPILQSASAARPNNPTLKYHLAVALKDLNRPDDAVAVLRPLLENAPSFEEKPAAQQLLADLTK